MPDEPPEEVATTAADEEEEDDDKVLVTAVLEVVVSRYADPAARDINPVRKTGVGGSTRTNESEKGMQKQEKNWVKERRNIAGQKKKTGQYPVCTFKVAQVITNPIRVIRSKGDIQMVLDWRH